VKKIFFRNRDQVVLYELEIKGQISDGHWENSYPDDHWIPMNEAQAEVVPQDLPKAFQGVEVPQEQREFLRQRAIDLALGPNFDTPRRYNFADLDLVDVVGDRMLFYVRLARLNPDWGFDKLEDAERAYICSSRAEVYATIQDVPYTYCDLLKDLLDMSRIVNRRYVEKAENEQGD
jgi:hypothetical protein